MVKLVYVVTGLAVLTVLWVVDPSRPVKTVISVVVVVGLFGWAIRREMAQEARWGHLRHLRPPPGTENSGRSRGPSIGNPGGYRYADAEIAAAAADDADADVSGDAADADAGVSGDGGGDGGGAGGGRR